MDNRGPIDADAAASVLAWWQDAGIGVEVAEDPRDWLAPPSARTAPAPSASAASAQSLLPDTLDAFLRWRLEGDDVPEAGWGSPRIPVAAAPRPLMILVDMPEGDDAAALMEGDVGRLFDRMLAAIGLSRDAVHLAALAWARPPGGTIDDRGAEPLAALARRHVMLAAPRAVLLMGQATSRALLATELAKARGQTLSIHHDGGQTGTVATWHPRMLLRTPAAKAGAWADLLRLKGLLA